MKNALVGLCLILAFNSNASTPNFVFPTKSVTVSAFEFLRGHKQGNSGYALQWSMTSTSGIGHYEIQCTYEDPNDEYSNWTTLGTAMNTRANIVRFTHQAVTPGFINYRVIAVLMDGRSTITSGILSITIE